MVLSDARAARYWQLALPFFSSTSTTQADTQIFRLLTKVAKSKAILLSANALNKSSCKVLPYNVYIWLCPEESFQSSLIVWVSKGKERVRQISVWEGVSGKWEHPCLTLVEPATGSVTAAEWVSSALKVSPFRGCQHWCVNKAGGQDFSMQAQVTPGRHPITSGCSYLCLVTMSLHSKEEWGWGVPQDGRIHVDTYSLNPAGTHSDAN